MDPYRRWRQFAFAVSAMLGVLTAASLCLAAAMWIFVLVDVLTGLPGWPR